MDQLFARVQEHDDSIVRLDATIEKNAVSCLLALLLCSLRGLRLLALQAARAARRCLVSACLPQRLTPSATPLPLPSLSRAGHC